MLNQQHSWRRVASAVAVAILLVFVPRTLVAQAGREAVQRNIPFANPEQFFNGFFGEEAEQERNALRRVEIPAAEERKFGDAAAEQFLLEMKRQEIDVADRGRDVEYLTRLAEVIRPQMENAARYRRIKIYVANSPHADARSFPGGTLVFFRGMLDLAENEAALVGVLGHELSHLDRGHQLLPLRRAKFAQTTFSDRNGFSPEEFFANMGTMVRTFMKPFRLEDEAEADRDGATWAYRAGYDPREMAKLFLVMHRRDAGKGADFMPAFLRTHPFHMDRFRAVNDLYDELQRATPQDHLYLGRENLERRIARSQEEFAE
jgi:predicted Zn-dependent protease